MSCKQPMSYLMPPVSKCMRWQQSVSDDFVRPMHTLSFPQTSNPAVCSRRLYFRLSVCTVGSSPVLSNSQVITASVCTVKQRVLVWPGQYDHVSLLPRWADAVTLPVCASASEALEHLSTTGVSPITRAHLPGNGNKYLTCQTKATINSHPMVYEQGIEERVGDMG